MSGREGGGGAVGKIEQSKTKEQKANRESVRKENESKEQILSMDADLVPLYVCVCNRNRYKDMNI